MLRKAMSVATLAALLAGANAFADTLIVEGITSPDQSAGYPARGQTKAAVEAVLGAPQARSGPVGKPPISNWDYGTFVVFFEYDRVLHTVTKR